MNGRDYKLLNYRLLGASARLEVPFQSHERVLLDSPALRVMTDLRQVPAATIDADAPMDVAHRFMIRRGVRLLLVTDEHRRVLGLVTANDISGERPVTFAVERGVRREDILVRDVMTPREKLEVLLYDEVATAEVGHIVATLRAAGRQHALVAHPDREDSGETVRGIFSLSQIARQLGVALSSTELAHTFAEIEAAIAR